MNMVFTSKHDPKQDALVVGLLLSLVVASTIPILSTATILLSTLLLVIVWLPVIEGQKK